MAYFPVDDQFPFHRKTIAAGNAAIGLWTRAGAWCQGTLTDGFVPVEIVRSLGTTAQAKALVTAGLWDKVDGGYRFRSWSDHNDSKADIEARRKADRERKAAARRASRPSGSPPDVQPDNQPEADRNPDGIRTASSLRARTYPTPPHPTPEEISGYVPDDDSPQVTREFAAPPPSSSSEFADGTPIPDEPDAPPPAEMRDDLPASVTVETGGKPRRPAATDSWRTAIRTLIGAGWPRQHVDDLAVRAAKLIDEGVERRHIEAGIQRFQTVPNAIPAWLPRIVGDVVRDEKSAQHAPRRAPTSREQVHLEAELMKDNPNPAVLAHFPEPKAIRS